MRCGPSTDCSASTVSEQDRKYPRKRLHAAPRWSIVVRPSGPASAATSNLASCSRASRSGHGRKRYLDCRRTHAGPARSRQAAGRHQSRGFDPGRRTPALGRGSCAASSICRPSWMTSARKSGDASVPFYPWAKLSGADQDCVAQHRKAWWSVGLKAPAPILCPPTWLAGRLSSRSMPAQLTHQHRARSLPAPASSPMRAMGRLVMWLNRNIDTGSGRTYAGGDQVRAQGSRAPAFRA